MRSPRGYAVFVLLVLMEMLAGFALLVGSSVLDATTLGYGMFWLLVLVSLFGLATGVLVARYGPRSPWNRVLMLAAGIAAAIVPALILTSTTVGLLSTVLILAVVYWRGLAISQEHPGFGEVQGRFGVGFGALFLGLLWVVARGVIYQRPIWYMLAIVGIAYTILSMAAMVTARIEQVREPGAARAVIFAVAMQLGVLLVLAVAVLQVFSLNVAGDLWGFTRPVWDTLGTAGFWFISLLAGPIDHLVALIRPHHTRGSSLSYVPTGGRRAVKAHRTRPSKTGNAWFVAVAILFLAALAGGIGWLICRSIPQLPTYQREQGFKEERKRLVSPGEMWLASLAWIASLFRRSAALAASTVQRTRKRLFGDFPEDPVRRAYAQLLRRAAAAGLPRAADTTPDEYREQLTARWPAVSFSVTALTDAYVLRRYGDVSFDAVQIERLRHHWQEIRGTIRVQRLPRPAEQTAGASPSLAGSGATASSAARPWSVSLARIRQEIRAPRPGDSDSGFTRTALILAVCLLTPILFILGLLILLAVISAHSGVPAHIPLLAI